MKTIHDILQLTADYLKQKGISNPRRQAELLMSDALNMERLQLYLEFERPLVESELKRCRERLLRRAQGEPLQYIHGQVEFFSCHFKVTRDVLIPRQETEILIDKIYQELSPLSLHGKKLWDLCTGSGCMGIALKKKLPSLEVTLSDLSNGALAIAKENANLNEVVVNFLQGDLLAPFQGKKTDFVVCNPPYISENEFQTLDSEVKNFEPRMALVSGNSGLEFYERLAKELPSFLNRGAKVWLEIGAGQGNALLSLFDKGPWKQFRCEQDWAGHDRFFFLEIE